MAGYITKEACYWPQDTSNFIAKIFSGFAYITKKKTRNNFTINNHYSEYIFVHGFTAQLASYFVRDSLSSIPAGDLWKTCDNSVVCLYCHGTEFFAFLSHACIVHQQLCGSHDCSRLFVLHVFLMCVISFQITKPWNVG